MLERRTRETLFCLLITLASVGLWGCARPEQPPEQSRIEEPAKVPEPQATSAAGPPETVEAEKLPPPQPDEVESKIKVVSGEAAVADKARSPYFLVGDFNGDGSPDLGLALKPAPERLDQLNQEYPKWMTRDPLSEVLPKPVVAVNRTPDPIDPAGAFGISVLPGDSLFAIIHGQGPKGWRDAEATQTYLLKNVTGDAMRTQERKEVAGMKRNPGPQIDGDVISERLLGQSGFLYFSYSGLTYKWYDPVHFKAEIMARPFHGMKAPKN